MPIWPSFLPPTSTFLPLPSIPLRPLDPSEMQAFRTALPRMLSPLLAKSTAAGRASVGMTGVRSIGCSSARRSDHLFVVRPPSPLSAQVLWGAGAGGDDVDADAGLVVCVGLDSIGTRLRTTQRSVPSLALLLSSSLLAASLLGSRQAALSQESMLMSCTLACRGLSSLCWWSPDPLLVHAGEHQARRGDHRSLPSPVQEGYAHS
jgi:hypothetical protein